MREAAWTIPEWLKAYPGAKVQVRAERPAFVDTTYATEAAPEPVVKHYEQLFQAAGQPFHPNFDGLGTTIRLAADRCDLLLVIHPAASGSQVRTSCSAKTGGALYGGLITGPSPSQEVKKETPKQVAEAEEPKAPVKPAAPPRPSRSTKRPPPPI